MITAPVQNLLVADRERIALYVTGRVPIRRAGDGSAPVPGDGSHDWIGWASGEQLPHIVAPASGRLVNANDRIAPPDFPVFLGRDWFGDWRAAPHPRTARSVGPPHRGRLRPHAGRCAFALCPPDPAGAAGRADRPRTPRGAPRRLLRDWDGSMTHRRAAAADLQRLDAPLLWPRAAAGRHRRERRRPAGGIRRLCAVSRRARIGAAVTAPPRCRRRWPMRSRDLTRRFGNDPARWRWGEAHPAVFAHPMLRPLPVLGPLGHALHPQSRRRHHDRSRRPALQTVSIGARSGVSRGV